MPTIVKQSKQLVPKLGTFVNTAVDFNHYNAECAFRRSYMLPNARKESHMARHKRRGKRR